MPAEGRVEANESTGVLVVFLTPGWGWDSSHPPKSVISNEQVLRALESRCPGVHFIARDISEPGTELESVIDEVETRKDALDGVLAFGGSRGEYRLALTGLPTIVVSNLFEFNAIPYELYREQGHILTASVSRLNVVSPSVATSMFDDLLEKIKLIQVLRKMKESTILAVTDRRLRYYPMPEKVPMAEVMQRQEDNRIYCDTLEESLGVKTVIIGSERVGEQIDNIADQEAEKTARIWIDEAEGWRDTSEADVVKGAKMYLALDRLKEEHGATALLTDTASFLKTIESCACLASTEFHKRGIVCADQPNTGPLLAQMLGLYLTGKPSFHGDFVVDTASGTSVLNHCGAPINPRGKDRVPYVLRDYRMGSDVLVELPVDEPVTTWRVNVMNKQVLLHTGEAVSISSVYKGPVGLNDITAGTKLVAKVDAKTIQAHLNPERDGVHRAAIYGDYRQQFADLTTLIGFELVEEDR